MAWQSLTSPEWFETLNEDFRYQLTPMGAAVVPYIAGEIARNPFRIAGGARWQKVSWQVTGIRHDAFANANRLQVEELKPDAAVGTYLHPEVFGQPVEKATTETAKDRKLEDQKARLRAISQKPSIR